MGSSGIMNVFECMSLALYERREPKFAARHHPACCIRQSMIAGFMVKGRGHRAWVPCRQALHLAAGTKPLPLTRTCSVSGINTCIVVIGISCTASCTACRAFACGGGIQQSAALQVFKIRAFFFRPLVTPGAVFKLQHPGCRLCVNAATSEPKTGRR